MADNAKNILSSICNKMLSDSASYTKCFNYTNTFETNGKAFHCLLRYMQVTAFESLGKVEFFGVLLSLVIRQSIGTWV